MANANVQEGLPFGRFQVVEVNFTSYEDTIRVPHQLNPESPTDVFYIPLRKSVDCTISDNLNDPPPKDQWTRQHIVLKSNTAPATVLFLLVTLR